eukprot:968677-Prorocentrum_minimum.AAC.1
MLRPRILGGSVELSSVYRAPARRVVCESPHAERLGSLLGDTRGYEWRLTLSIPSPLSRVSTPPSKGPGHTVSGAFVFQPFSNRTPVPAYINEVIRILYPDGDALHRALCIAIGVKDADYFVDVRGKGHTVERTHRFARRRDTVVERLNTGLMSVLSKLSANN